MMDGRGPGRYGQPGGGGGRRMSSDFGSGGDSLNAPINRRSEPSLRNCTSIMPVSALPRDTRDSRQYDHQRSRVNPPPPQHHQLPQHQQQQYSQRAHSNQIQHQNRLSQAQRSISSNSLFDGGVGGPPSHGQIRGGGLQVQGRQSPSMRSISSLEDLQTYGGGPERNYGEGTQRNIRRTASSGSLMTMVRVDREVPRGGGPPSTISRLGPANLPPPIPNKEKIDNYLSSLGQQQGGRRRSQGQAPTIASSRGVIGPPYTPSPCHEGFQESGKYTGSLKSSRFGGPPPQSHRGSIAGGSLISRVGSIAPSNMSNMSSGVSHPLNYKESFPLPLSFYLKAKELWPESGNHVLATYNSTAVILYLATNTPNARQIILNQSFKSIYEEIDWVLTPSFMCSVTWSGWATREDHDNVLALTVDRNGFEELLRAALDVELEARGSKGGGGMSMNPSTAVGASSNKDQRSLWIEWVNETDPFGMRLTRCAPLLHLNCYRDSYHVLKFIAEMVSEIDDITGFIRRQRKTFLAWSGGAAQLYVPTTRNYTFSDPRLGNQFSLMYLRPSGEEATEVLMDVDAMTNSMDTMSMDIEEPLEDSRSRRMSRGMSLKPPGSCLSRISSVPSVNSGMTLRGGTTTQENRGEMTSNSSPRRPMVDMTMSRDSGRSRINKHGGGSRTGTIRSRSSGISSLNSSFPASRASSQYLH